MSSSTWPTTRWPSGGVAQLLAPDGRLLLLVPALKTLYGSLDVQLGHHRRYTGQELHGKLAAAGLHAMECRYFGFAAAARWLLGSRVFGCRLLPTRQLLAYNRLVPLLRLVERLTGPPLGQSLFCVVAHDRGPGAGGAMADSWGLRARGGSEAASGTRWPP